MFELQLHKLRDVNLKNNFILSVLGSYYDYVIKKNRSDVSKIFIIQISFWVLKTCAICVIKLCFRVRNKYIVWDSLGFLFTTPH